MFKSISRIGLTSLVSKIIRHIICVCEPETEKKFGFQIGFGLQNFGFSGLDSDLDFGFFGFSGLDSGIYFRFFGSELES